MPPPAPPADASSPPAEPSLRFDRLARPHPAMRRWCHLLALLSCAGSAFLLPLLIPAPHLGIWGLIGLLVGAGLGWIILASVGSGTRITVDAQGILSYHLAGRENLRVPLQAIERWGAIDCGILKGIGADCPLEAIEILHRKGVRIPQLRDQQRELGFALVFEFHDPADIPALEGIARALEEDTKGTKIHEGHEG